MESSAAIILWTGVLVSVSVGVTALEDLALKAALFTDNLFDWRYCLSFQPFLRPSRPTLFWQRSFGLTAFRLLAGARLVASIGLVFSLLYASKLVPFCLIVLILLYSYLFYRVPYSLDGSDQMTYFVLIGLLIMTSGKANHERYVLLGSAIISIHTAICYLTSGLAKLSGPLWRSGTALSAIMASGEFGSKHLSSVLHDRPALNRILSWLLIASHILAGLSILAGGYWCFFAIFFTATFHMTVAMSMRLNVFVWAFASTYPSLIFFAYWPRRQQLWNEVTAAFTGLF